MLKVTFQRSCVVFFFVLIFFLFKMDTFVLGCAGSSAPCVGSVAVARGLVALRRVASSQARD